MLSGLHTFGSAVGDAVINEGGREETKQPVGHGVGGTEGVREAVCDRDCVGDRDGVMDDDGICSTYGEHIGGDAAPAHHAEEGTSMCPPSSRLT